jgi:hypothetical protein
MAYSILSKINLFFFLNRKISRSPYVRAYVIIKTTKPGTEEQTNWTFGLYRPVYDNDYMFIPSRNSFQRKRMQCFDVQKSHVLYLGLYE